MNELNVFTSGSNASEGSLQSVTAAMAMTRQAQEVQAAMIVAKRFPRNEADSMDRILTACQRQTLAEAAIYSFPRGGSEVSGPSIRLAEAIAQNWGNIDFGFVELEERNNASQVMAYAWDLETNTRQSKVFTVPHKRDTKKGSQPLTDSRDIYEMIANQAARRVRSCILSIIPGDVVESAVKQCELTLRAGNKTPIEERRQNMVTAFAEFDITPEQLAGFIGKNIDAFTENDLARLTKIYRSIKDGVVGNDYFLTRMKESAPAQNATQTAQEAPQEGRDTTRKGKGRQSAAKAAEQAAPVPAYEPNEYTDYDGDEELPFEMGLDDL